MSIPDQISPKVLDILAESLRQTLRTVDLAFAFAVIATAVVFAWGMEGDFERNFRDVVGASARSPLCPSDGLESKEVPRQEVETPVEVPRQKVEVPVLGFKANLGIAATLALVCYVVFTIRAGNHLRRARHIADRLGSLDKAHARSSAYYTLNSYRLAVVPGDPFAATWCDGFWRTCDPASTIECLRLPASFAASGRCRPLDARASPLLGLEPCHLAPCEA